MTVAREIKAKRAFGQSQRRVDRSLSRTVFTIAHGLGAFLAAAVRDDVEEHLGAFAQIVETTFLNGRVVGQFNLPRRTAAWWVLALFSGVGSQSGFSPMSIICNVDNRLGELIGVPTGLVIFGSLNPHETHGRTPHRLTACLRVGGIVLIALDVGLHIRCRHQADLVAQLRQLTRPMVRRGTGFHADEARRQSFEERDNLAAAKLLSDDDLLGPSMP